MEQPARASGPAPKERHPRDVAQHRLDDFCSAGFFCPSATNHVYGDDLDGCYGSSAITCAFPSSAFLISRLRIHESKFSVISFCMLSSSSRTID